MKKIDNTDLLLRWKWECEVVGRRNRRVEKLNRVRIAFAKKQYDLDIVEWKKQCTEVKKQNTQEIKRVKAHNSKTFAEVREFNENIDFLNEQGEYISSFLIRIWNPLKYKLGFQNEHIIEVTMPELKYLCNIDLEQDVNFDLLFDETTIRVKNIETNQVMWVRQDNYWGYVDLNGIKYPYHILEEIPKFEKIEFKKLRKKGRVVLVANKIQFPQKPKKIDIIPYPMLPLPSKPLDVFVGIASDKIFKKYDFVLEKW